MTEINRRVPLFSKVLFFYFIFNGLIIIFFFGCFPQFKIDSDNNSSYFNTHLAASTEWYKTLGNESEDWGYDVEVDNTTGDVYLVAYETDIILGHKKIVLFKLDSSGNVQWKRDWYEVNEDTIGTNLALGPNESVYIGGMVTAPGNMLKMVLVKYNSSTGDELWNNTFGNCHPALDFGVGLDVDSKGNAYICCNNDLDPGASQYDYEMELVKFNKTGGFEWNVTWKAGVGFYDIAYGLGIAIDSSDMVYVTGYRCCSVLYGMSEVFLLKYDGDNNLIFDELWETSGNDMGCSVGVGPDGYIYVAGMTDADGFGEDGDFLLLKYSSSGAFIWDAVYGGSYTDLTGDLAFDSSGNIYLVGTKCFSNEGDGEICWLKYNDQGEKQSCSIWGGSREEQGYGIDIDTDGNMYITGITESYGQGNFDIVLIKNPEQKSCAEPEEEIPNPFQIPWWLQAIIGGIISAATGLFIKIGYTKISKKRMAQNFTKIEETIDQIDNLKEHLMVALGPKWNQIKDSFKEYNEGYIGKGEFIKRGQEILGRKFNKALLIKPEL